ncbi:hypothetical protein QYE76_064845 [Lolium multiflorum]|uniref:Reverse transcriptase Ty1/copia-type domain-containing protein n=1 Tax=Lolium multiflorum TaxID=4521 RepID=A0AAD8S9R5_LOLMU|nr:hypothetical protein QYE76_064845 [Lolium multiflorum]
MDGGEDVGGLSEERREAEAWAAPAAAGDSFPAAGIMGERRPLAFFFLELIRLRRIMYLVDDTPTSILEAYTSLDADYWKEAVRSEMDSILANGTWEITDRPYGCKPVGCKWVFKKKLRPDGTIEKYKARLVAKGYTQKEGEDFFDRYSHVARLTTI